jgi:hypothetical protein
MRTLTAVTFLLSAVFMTGCGSKIPGLVPAEGTVLYDGKPLAWAVVRFSPLENDSAGNRLATAQTDVHGKFSLNTLGRPGALPNRYAVAVVKEIKDNGKDTLADWRRLQQEEGTQEPLPEDGIYDTVSVIPKKYTSPKTSEIIIEIEKK